MKQSHVIEIDGIFVGAAARYGDRYRFVGVDSRLKEMDGQLFTALSDVREAASRTYRRAPYVPAAKRIDLLAMPAA
ncbi:hypothetical protein [Acidisoma sp. 7E03]